MEKAALLGKSCYIKPNLFVCFFVLYAVYIFQQISTEFGIWHPYTPRMVMNGKYGHYLANTVEP